MNAATFDLYFHDRDCDIDYGHGYKENFKDTSCHQKWHNNVKKGKWKCENIDKKMKVYIIITVVKAIWVVLIVHQNILQIMRRTSKHILLMKMVILIIAIWMLLILILLFFLLKQMEALITSLIMRVLKKISHWYLRLYEKRMFALVPKDTCLIDSATTYTILKSNKIFSCLIMRNINVNIIYSTTNIFEDSRRAIILLPKSWIETYYVSKIFV